MVRKRITRSAEDFIEAAEKPVTPQAEGTDTTSPHTTESAEIKERVKARAKASIKRGIYTIQATESQKALLDYAAEELDISKAKLLERYLFTALEEEFGSSVPITNTK